MTTQDDQTKNILRLAKLIVIGMLVQLLVIGYVFYSNYQGRKDNVKSLRAGCERGKIDRKDSARAARANATNWSKAAAIRRKSGDISVALAYEGNSLKQTISADSLLRRSRINCAEAYPKASILR